MEKGSEKGKGGLKTGTLLQHGRYRIIRYISQGGFGCTYEAEHTMFNERVAIKELFISEYCNRNSETGVISVGVSSKKGLIDRLYRKFIDEARAQRKMQHPNIVRVIDVFEENSTAFYVMDYIEGDSLESIIQKRKSPMSEHEAVGYIRMVADALDYVHSQKCLHLDVKPGNIMIDKSGKAILIDFGASKQYDEQGSNASTVTGFTRGYAPIEQVGGHINTFSPASDIFSLGSTLYRLLTGELPVDCLGRMSGMNLKLLPADVSPATRRAVECSMNISIGDRPQTIREFLSLLDGDGDVVEEPEVEVSPATEIVGGGDGLPPTEATLISCDSNDIDPKPLIEIVSRSYGEPQRKRGMGRRMVFIAVALAILAFAVTIMMMRGCGAKSESTADSTADSTVPEGYVDLGLSKYWATKNLIEDDGCLCLSLDEVEALIPNEYTMPDTLTNRYMIPTEDDWNELCEKCSWKWSPEYTGYQVTGPTGESIFIPADGIVDFEAKNHIKEGRGKFGVYWTSTDGRSFSFTNEAVAFDTLYKNRGYSARPVYDPRN